MSDGVVMFAEVELEGRVVLFEVELVPVGEVELLLTEVVLDGDAATEVEVTFAVAEVVEFAEGEVELVSTEVVLEGIAAEDVEVTLVASEVVEFAEIVVLMGKSEVYVPVEVVLAPPTVELVPLTAAICHHGAARVREGQPTMSPTTTAVR